MTNLEILHNEFNKDENGISYPYDERTDMESAVNIFESMGGEVNNTMLRTFSIEYTYNGDLTVDDYMGILIAHEIGVYNVDTYSVFYTQTLTEEYLNIDEPDINGFINALSLYYTGYEYDPEEFVYEGFTGVEDELIENFNQQIEEELDDIYSEGGRADQILEENLQTYGITETSMEYVNNTDNNDTNLFGIAAIILAACIGFAAVISVLPNKNKK